MKRIVVALFALVLVAPAFAGNWQYWNEADKMRGTTTHFASLRSDNAVNLSPPYEGGTRMDLVFTQGQRSHTAFLAIFNGQFNCGPERCVAVAYKMDTGPVRDLAGRSPSFDTIFLDDPDAFIKETLGAKELIVEVPIYRGGLQQFTFDVSGLKWPPE